MNSCRILITGGAGFVGSCIAVRLRELFSEATIVAMDNLYRRGSELSLQRLRMNGVLFHYGDVRDPGSFPEAPFDFVIDCAAEPSVQAGLNGSPDYLYQTNLTGTYHCLERARQCNAGFLFLSTSRVYPIAQIEAHPWVEEATRFCWNDTQTTGISSRGVTEDLSMRGARSLYGWTKYSAEQLIEEYRAAFGLKAVINRCGMLAGPWQFGKSDQGVISHWVQAHVLGRPLQYIGYGGAGKQVRDVLHIDDLCDLVVEQLGDFSSWDGWMSNVSGGVENSTSLLDLTRLCQQATSRCVPIHPVLDTRPADLRIFIADCARLHARTRWRPQRSLQAIVEDLAAWVLDERPRLEALQ